jgi:uroporphyrinogen-III synthase
MSYPEIHILSTKQLDQQLKEDAGSKNILIDERSFINIEPASQEKVKQLIATTGSDAVVVFTSSNAAEIVGRQVNSIDINWKIFSLGFATRETVSSFFGEKNIAGTADNAGQLSDLIISEDNIKNIIFFCGDKRRDTLPEKLRANGIGVEEKTIYNTIEVPYRINKKYNGIAFFSPSAVRAFFELNTDETGDDFFSIGETTSAEIKKFTKKNVIVADEPSQRKLLDSIYKHYNRATSNG